MQEMELASESRNKRLTKDVNAPLLAWLAGYAGEECADYVDFFRDGTHAFALSLACYTCCREVPRFSMKGQKCC